MDIATWAVPFGIIGGRLYHVVTSWQPYFGPSGNPFHALYIWEGGMGVWAPSRSARSGPGSAPGVPV